MDPNDQPLSPAMVMCCACGLVVAIAAFCALAVLAVAPWAPGRWGDLGLAATMTVIGVVFWRWTVPAVGLMVRRPPLSFVLEGTVAAFAIFAGRGVVVVMVSMIIAGIAVSFMMPGWAVAIGATIVAGGATTPLIRGLAPVDPQRVAEIVILVIECAGVVWVGRVWRLDLQEEVDQREVMRTQPRTEVTGPTPTMLGILTPRQAEAVVHFCAGRRHKEIADELGISVGQVYRLLQQARERTGSLTGLELAHWAREELAA